MRSESIQISENATLLTFIQDSAISFQVYQRKPAIIICPGGGYLIHGTREGEPVAVDFLAKGFHCFVLKYATGADREHPEQGINPYIRYPQQALEVMETIHLLHERADEWYIDTDQIFLMGFSAGGHICATVGVRWDDPKLTSQLSFVPENEELRVAGMVLCYPMLGNNPAEFIDTQQRTLSAGQNRQMLLMNHVLYGTEAPDTSMKDKADLWNYISDKTLPTFIWHSIDDPIIDAENSTRFIDKLQHYHIRCEYHLFSRGGHGLGLAADSNLGLWRELALNWMRM